MSESSQKLRDALAKMAEIAGEAVAAYDDAPEAAPKPTKRAVPTKKLDSKESDPFRARPVEDVVLQKHIYANGAVCNTDKLGYAAPDNRDPLSLRVDASNGFIPLWARGTTLNWRFNEASMRYFRNPEAAKTALEALFSEAMAAWGDAVPVRFSKNNDVWDFEFFMRSQNDCDSNGCVLAEAFFPDSGRHRLNLYPKMFEQVRQEQIETLCHEFGHVFGLRHFFANVSETGFPSVLFGTDSRFSIMNYGANSYLTETDKSDLKRLYQAAWSGQLTRINGTPIRLVRPYHAAGFGPGRLVADVAGNQDCGCNH